MNDLAGTRIHITGIVQGVGFRPFVYGLARRFELTGWVRNTSAGVDIEVDGRPPTLQAFIHALQTETPPLARIDHFQAAECPANGFTSFEIRHSQPVADAFQPISPDVSLCPDCQRELFDPADRRHRYPFINCTNCGPRFTIIQDIPYDRPKTTMAPFPMCPDCAQEYRDPLDRRFHAQPVACPVCGPQVWLESGEREAGSEGEAAIQETRRLLAAGKIVAIKGLGGFHLACDATNPAAVAELRQRKLRVDKPFAVMMWDSAAVARHCHLSPAEKELLESRARPIVILQQHGGSGIATVVTPNQTSLGVMLPYTPLHLLLLEPEPGFPDALVMTSGNLSEEPIAYTNEDALTRLANIADAFLLHNRAIHTRCDDSVMRVTQSKIQNRKSKITPLRRSRGYAPFPVKLPWRVPPILATGAELKNTFCLTRDAYAFLSHHIGDMENYETLLSFEEGIAHFERLFRIQPEILAYDMHPNYLASRYALERAEREGVTAVHVQHHHAHIAAGMAEHGLTGDEPVIGVAFDGTGYGDDGAIWGGEFLIADYRGYQRAAHLKYIPLPGGDKAIKEPWRIALAYWLDCGFPIADFALTAQSKIQNPKSKIIQAVQHQIKTGLNAPLTSSMGRLFDAVAALAGVRQTVNYEAQAAIELEALVDEAETAVYPFDYQDGVIDVGEMVTAVIRDRQHKIPISQIAARFHNSIAQMVLDVCRQLSQQTGLTQVVLSGGVWQNMTLLTKTIPLLQNAGLIVFIHNQVPANDGGLALGQAVIASSIQ